MALMPPSLAGKIQFVESHLSVWQAHATEIGSTTTEISAIQTLAQTARTSLTAQEEAQNNAKTKTAALRSAVDAMVNATSQLVIKVRAKAATDGDTIYQLADIPAPATPTPVNTLGKPSDFVVTLSESGALDLTWKCASPRATGVLYQIWRRIGPTASFEYLGGTGEKEFTDDTLPMGSSQVTYQLQAARSTATGPWAQFNVNFGVSSGGGGATIASVSEQTPSPKIAA